jgi:hypothetical protein
MKLGQNINSQMSELGQNCPIAYSVDAGDGATKAAERARKLKVRRTSILASIDSLSVNAAEE